MGRPVLVDLFCGGGGASAGYVAAGFDVVGVDIVRKRSYPYEFVQADALSFALDGFDAIHASPPCKAFTTARANAGDLRLFDPHADLLTPTLQRLSSRSVPWVVENVIGAPMPAGSIMLCGSSFGLDVRRHRLFASNVQLWSPPCDHARQTPRFQSNDWTIRNGGGLASVVGVHGNLTGGTDTLAVRRDAMGIDWLENDELTQAIPPAYTRHVGQILLGALADD